MPPPLAKAIGLEIKLCMLAKAREGVPGTALVGRILARPAPTLPLPTRGPGDCPRSLPEKLKQEAMVIKEP